MCFFFSFMPATFWLVVGYFVLYSATKARSCDLDIPDIRADSDGRCLRYAERYVPNRGFHAMGELTEDSSDVRDSKMVLRS
jgi:hypothetical protein